MHSKLIGGILLITGTTIGAGMLALPIATAQLGFIGSVALLIGCWAIMTACAFLFLEVNLWLPHDTNLVSMAGVTLGRPGQVVAWLFFLGLLYSIISAYIAGGGDLFHYLLNSQGIPISLPLSSLLFTVLLGWVVYFGIRSVDYVNRGLMFGKMGAYVVLVLLILPFISFDHLGEGELKHFFAPSSITVTATAFASMMIIPSLRSYFEGDTKRLRKAILIGMFIPLLCYIAWDMVIMGVIPLTNLEQMFHSSSSNSNLVIALKTMLDFKAITLLAKFFTSICMATSFLSVSLSLTDFLADGLRVKKEGLSHMLVIGLTFLPPLLAVVFYPDAFIRGLNYAGISVLVLMMLLPPLMVWSGRYYKKGLAKGDYQVAGGKVLLALLVIFATLMLGLSLESTV